MIDLPEHFRAADAALRVARQYFPYRSPQRRAIELVAKLCREAGVQIVRAQISSDSSQPQERT